MDAHWADWTADCSDSQKAVRMDAPQEPTKVWQSAANWAVCSALTWAGDWVARTACSTVAPKETLSAVSMAARSVCSSAAKMVSTMAARADDCWVEWMDATMAVNWADLKAAAKDDCLVESSV